MRNIHLFWRSWLLSTCIILPVLSFAQVNQEWVARYNGPGNDADGAAAVVVDASGNVYVTGFSVGSGTQFDYATIKYNAAGVQQWEARYNGPGNDFDAARSLVVDASGNVYVTGSSIGMGTDRDYATIKYNAAGVEQWVARYNGPGNGSDDANSLAVDAAGNVYVTGSSTGIGTGEDYTTIKYNAAGVQQWEVRYNGPGNDVDGAVALALGEDGNVYVTGSSTGSGTSSDYATIKYNAAGVQQWVARYNNTGNSFERAQSLAIDAAGNAYVTGGSFISEIGWDYATVKYNAAGTQQWEAIYNGPGNFDDIAAAIAADDNGNAYVTGMSNMEPFFDPGDPSSAEYATIKYDASGNELWVAKYNGPETGFDAASDLAVDTSGNVYVTGESRGSGTGPDYATVKYNTDGIQQWEARYNGPGNSTDQATSLAIDVLGNVYVTGTSFGGPFGTGTWFDYATIKYSQQLFACGNQGNKVLVCHKGNKTLCISESDVSDHLSHGDQLGECVVDAARIGADKSQPSERSNEMPDRFRTFNAPNPVSMTTKIYYELPAAGHVSIKVFDMLGRTIKTLVDADRQAGYHNTEFNVSALQKGLYYYHITVKAKNKVWGQTGKISVVK